MTNGSALELFQEAVKVIIVSKFSISGLLQLWQVLMLYDLLRIVGYMRIFFVPIGDTLSSINRSIKKGNILQSGFVNSTWADLCIRWIGVPIDMLGLLRWFKFGGNYHNCIG